MRTWPTPRLQFRGRHAERRGAPRRRRHADPRSRRAGGEAFYHDVAERIGDPRAAELLRRNGREETVHGERVRQVIAILSGEAPAQDRR
jgi:hypothetical protein